MYFLEDQPERCLRHGVEGLFEVNVDSINSLALSVSFLLNEVHLLHVNANATSLPASTLTWFWDVSWLDNFSNRIEDMDQQLIHTLSKTTGRWSDVLFVPPPLWRCEIVPSIVACCGLVSWGSWRIFGNTSVTTVQWSRAQDLINLDYSQVPGSIQAETPSTQINTDLGKYTLKQRFKTTVWSNHANKIKSLKISFTHIFTIWNSLFVIVLMSLLRHISGPVDDDCFYYYKK